QYRVSRADWHLRVAGNRSRAAGTHSAKALECRAQGDGPKEHDDDAPGCAPKSRGRHHFAGRDPQGLLRRFARMTAFRQQDVKGNGSTVGGVIEAEDRKTALQTLGQRGLFPSTLEISASPAEAGDGSVLLGGARQ